MQLAQKNLRVRVLIFLCDRVYDYSENAQIDAILDLEKVEQILAEETEIPKKKS